MHGETIKNIFILFVCMHWGQLWEVIAGCIGVSPGNSSENYEFDSTGTGLCYFYA